MGAVNDKDSLVRVKFKPTTIENLSSVLTQLEKEFGKMFSKIDDVAELLLSIRSKSLSKRELDFIRKKVLTDEQRAEWVLARVKEASSSGVKADFKSLLRQIKTSR